MTQEEARIRLAVSPPALEERFWTIVAMAPEGEPFFLPDDATYTMAVSRYAVGASDALMWRDSKEGTERVVREWNGLSERDGSGFAFVAVEVRMTLKCA